MDSDHVTGRRATLWNGRLAADIATLSGVGPRRAAALRARDLTTLGDVLMRIPSRYEDLRRRDQISALRPGMNAVVEGVLHDVVQRPMRGIRWRQLVSGFFSQGPHQRMRVVWFNFHGGRLPVGEALLLSGRVSLASDGKLELVHPDIQRLEAGKVAPLRPIYPLPAEVPQRLFSAMVKQALAAAPAAGLDAIATELRKREGRPSVAEALSQLHQPAADAALDELNAGRSAAHQALAFDEMFAFQLALARERARRQNRSGAVLNGPARLTAEFMAALPFAATGAQLRALDEIAADLAGPAQMNRILIGDVGSGKTLVAFQATLQAVESGWQAAVMAPTELLAEQHFANFNRMCGRLGVTAALLTGKLGGNERARIRRALKRGDIAVAFGTHALVQEGVAMERLGLAVIDEQHRFGVFDRARLIALGSQANVLLMTATPIPRSLALALFRNLHVSTLDQMPPGRVPVTTAIFTEDQLGTVDAMVKQELQAGHRAYYVLPLIDEQDDPDSVTASKKRLETGPLRDFRIGALHGRMRPVDKDQMMRDFRDGAVQVLVATTVVEVGIDVPEATIIVIIAAERYGLAQLHQLRGRVGRGGAASRCCLVIGPQATPPTMARIKALAEARSGAEVAELDLKLRGPGDLFGARQTGALALRFARFIGDFALIERAADLAEQWLRHDPELQSPDSAGARTALDRLLDSGFSLGDVG